MTTAAAAPNLRTQTPNLFSYNLNRNYDNNNGKLFYFVTETVTGFVDFITTIGNTVMVFTPQTTTRARETGKNQC